MKLFVVEVLDDTELFFRAVIASSAEEAERRVLKQEYWSCPMYASATEIDKIDGFKIVLEEV